MAIDDKEFYYNEVFKDFEKKENFQIQSNKKLGNGTFGIVKPIIYKNKKCAGKLVAKEKFDEEVKYLKDLIGPNIIKIEKICEPISKFGKDYNLIIMERASLQNLAKLINYIHDKNLLKLINLDCFDEKTSDTLLRYFARQIINGFMTLYQNNYVHFDIKPENILVLNNCILKISDFGMTRKIEDNVKEFKIPGGTPSYLTPEYLLDKRVDAEEARAQDYFALGCTLFYLKEGKVLLSYNKDEDRDNKADIVTNLLNINTNYIRARKLYDKDLITFITNLINIDPKERLNIEEIYRNKWLNKNLDIINTIAEDYDMSEEKLLLELQKQDFFMQKKEIFEFNHPEIKVTSNKNKERYKRKCFKFKKMEKYIEKINNIESNN